jgi:hypothetical protein
MNQKLLILQAEWYAKLKAEGFSDIEDLKNPNRPLKIYHSSRIPKTQTQIDAAYLFWDDYYSWAENILETEQFASVIHKKIWELHSRGMSWRKISAFILKEYPRKRGYRRQHIGQIITCIKRKYGR